MGQRRINIKNWITVISVLIAVVSLWIAWRSLQSQEKGLRLTESDLEKSSAPIWVAHMSNDGTVMFFNGEANGMILQEATIIFASYLGVAATDAKPPGYAASLGQFIKGVKDILIYEKEYKKFEEGKVAKYIERKFPVLVSSRYAYKGDEHKDTAVYFLVYR